MNNMIPIFLPMNTSGGGRVPIWFYLLIMIPLCIFGIYLLFDIIDYSLCGSRIKANIYFNNECNYVVPDGYKIVSDGKLYAIKCNDGNYLHLSMDLTIRIEETFEGIDDPTLFYSECKAKDCLKLYLEPPISKFK